MKWLPIIFNIDAWEEVLVSIQKHKIRTFITGFNVAFGIFIFVLLLGFGTGFKNGVAKQFKSAVNMIRIWRGTTSMPYAGMKEGRTIVFSNDDYNEILETVDNIGISSRKNRIRGISTVAYKNKTSSFEIEAFDEKFIDIEKLKMVSGRYLNKKDIIEKNKVVVIGKTVKDVMFKKKDPIGEYLKLNNIMFKIIGVFEKKDQQWANRRVHIPISTEQLIFSRGDKFVSMMFSVADGLTSSSEKMIKQIKQILSKNHLFNPKDERAINIFNMQKTYARWSSVFNGIKIILGIVGIMTLISGVVGVGNIMLIIAKEKRREIGLRKAIGSSRRSIISLFLLESSFVTIVSGYLGLLIGISILRLGLFEKMMISFGFPERFMINPDVETSIALVATFILVISGILAGYFPAKLAAKVSPIEALKDE